REARAPRAFLDREAEHEVRGIEEEQDEEEHQLVRVPGPPDAPRGLRPDRPRDQGQSAEDRPLVDADIALEVVALVTLPQVEQRLQRTPPEPRVCRQGD